MRKSWRDRYATLGLMVGVAAIVACATEAAPPAREELQRSDAQPSGTGARAAASPALSAKTGAVQSDEETAAVPSTGWLEPASSAMVVRTATASVEVGTLDSAITAVRRLTGSVGGYLGNASIQTGAHQVRQATLQIKVPAARFDDLTAGLAPLGKVEYVTVNAEDVGEEFTDLAARATNAHRLEARLIELLATRTGRLQDVLSVERELARVREDIERMEGRMRFLRSRAAMSELSVALHEPLPLLVEAPGRNPLAEAVRQAWRNAIEVAAAIVAGAGTLAPVAAVAGAILYLVRRRRRRPVPTPSAAIP